MPIRASKLILIALISFAVACGDDDSSNENNVNNTNNVNNEDWDIEVAGTWSTPFMTTEVITDDMWDVQEIASFDNEENVAITFADASAEFNPETYSKLVWTEPEADVFHYCTVAFGLDTEQEAMEAEDIGDRNDLDGEGCNGFPWTEMTRQ